MINKRLITLLLVCATACLQVVAENSSSEEKPIVNVIVSSETTMDGYKQAFDIMAQSTGVSKILEIARAEAYNKLMPELLGKTHNVGSKLEESYISNDKLVSRGVDQIVAEMRIEGSWELKDGVYYYTLYLIIQNPEEKK